MTVAELIEELKKYPAETEVKVYDNEYGGDFPLETCALRPSLAHDSAPVIRLSRFSNHAGI